MPDIDHMPTETPGEGTESGKRETFVLYSIDRDLLAKRLKEVQVLRPEYTKSQVLRDMIRATDESFYAQVV